MFLLVGAVALLLAFGCAKVSLLMLARGTARHHELAIRSAIGSSRMLLAGISILACLVAARQASSVDPITALRYE